MITSKNEYEEYLRLDRIALGYSENLTLKLRLKQMFWPDKTFQFEKTLRKYEFYHNCRRKSIIWAMHYFIARYQHRRLSLKLGFSIGPNIFGPGLSIPHYGTIVINPNVRIGKNCRLHTGVNIGASGGTNHWGQCLYWSRCHSFRRYKNWQQCYGWS